MRQHRTAAAALLGVAALLLAPAVGSAQVNFRVGNPYYASGYYGYSPYGWGIASPYSGYYSGPMWSGNYGYYGTGSPWPGYYAGYPGSAWSGYYGTYPGWANSYPSYYSSPDYYSTPSTSYGYSSASGTGSYYYGSPSREGTNTALLNVRLPDPNAEVWVEGRATQQRGTSREYVSPPLNPDRSYVYDVRARWTENGKEVERTRTVPVKVGGVATVDFTAPENNSRVDEIDRGRTTPRPSGEAKPGEARPRDEKPRDVKPGDTGRPGDPDRRPPSP